MKICFLTGDIFKLGGVQRVLSVIASELCEYHDIDIVCGDKKIVIDRSIYNLKEEVNIINFKGLKSNNIINRSLKLMNKITGIFNNKIMYKILELVYFTYPIQNKLINYLNSNTYDVVIGVEGYYSLLLGVIKDKISAKTIGWQHNSYDAYLNNKYKYYWKQDILFEKYIRKLDKYIVLNEYDKKKYKECKNIICDVIYNPKSFESIEKSTVENNFFLSAGRFTHQKGFDLLIESFKLFSEKNDSWKLLIVGEGKEKNNVLKKVKEYGLEDRIIIKDFTKDIKKYFVESSVLLLSSRWEGMPMIALESLEMGVPIIAYDITAIRPIIDNMINGIIVDKFNVNEFSDAMLKISESYTLRKKMSEICIEKSKDFDIDGIIIKWNELLIQNFNL